MKADGAAVFDRVGETVAGQKRTLVFPEKCRLQRLPRCRHCRKCQLARFAELIYDDHHADTI